MIYVCEIGCKYEGGSAFAATTHLPTAWRLIRERRIAGEADRRCGRRQVARLKGWMWWEDDFDYYIIKRYVDAAHNSELRGAKPIGEASRSNDVLGMEE